MSRYEQFEISPETIAQEKNSADNLTDNRFKENIDRECSFKSTGKQPEHGVSQAGQ